MAALVIKLLERCKAKALVSSFLLADRAVEDAMLAAARRGVRVYVLLASEARLGREASEGEFEQAVLEQHTAMLARLAGHALFRSAPHFHAKLVIIDPEIDPQGLLLTSNLTKAALERNEELAVELTIDEVREATAIVRWALWESAEHEMADPDDRFRAVRPLGRIVHPLPTGSILATTSGTQSIRSALLELVDGARSRIVVSSFGFDVDHEVVQRLCARAREGVEVTVLARVRPAAMPALIALAEAGAEVRGFNWLHAKAIWTDRDEGLVTSANLQADGLDHGFELAVRLSGERAQELERRLDDWRQTAPWMLHAAPRLGDVVGKVSIWSKGRLQDAEIAPMLEIPLGSAIAASADDLQAARPEMPLVGELPALAHDIRCAWTAVAPTLDAKAKIVPKPAAGYPSEAAAPRVFREPAGRLVVAVRHPGELEAAAALCKEIGAAAIVVDAGGQR